MICPEGDRSPAYMLKSNRQLLVCTHIRLSTLIFVFKWWSTKSCLVDFDECYATYRPVLGHNYSVKLRSRPNKHRCVTSFNHFCVITDSIACTHKTFKREVKESAQMLSVVSSC